MSPWRSIRPRTLDARLKAAGAQYYVRRSESVDLGVVDLVHVGQALVYLSLVFSVASAAQYTRLFAAAVEAKEARVHPKQ